MYRDTTQKEIYYGCWENQSWFFLCLKINKLDQQEGTFKNLLGIFKIYFEPTKNFHCLKILVRKKIIERKKEINEEKQSFQKFASKKKYLVERTFLFLINFINFF